jgi:hypothetical protein
MSPPAWVPDIADTPVRGSNKSLLCAGELRNAKAFAALKLDKISTLFDALMNNLKPPPDPASIS